MKSIFKTIGKLLNMLIDELVKSGNMTIETSNNLFGGPRNEYKVSIKSTANRK